MSTIDLRTGFARMVCLVCLLAAGSLSARTVALWPMERPANGGTTVACAVDPAANSLTKDATVVSFCSDTLGWTLPPNPDRGAATVDPFNVDNAVISSNANTPFVSSGSALTEHLIVTNSFTLEGWFRLDQLPAEGTWAVIVQTLESAQPGAWNLTLRNKTGLDKTTLHFETFVNSDVVTGKTFTDAEAAALVGKWHHLAIVNAVSGNKGSLEVFMDGTSLGSARSYTVPVIADESQITRVFKFFGRGGNNGLIGACTYWRLSDQALTPAEFLCGDPAAGLTGTSVRLPTTTTLSYWKMCVTNGVPDVSDHVGKAHLHAAYYSTNPHAAVAPVDDCAFEGNPPNTTVTLATGNHGSAEVVGAGGGFKDNGKNNVAASLIPAGKSFTVECWYKPGSDGVSAETRPFGRLFAVASADVAWSLRIVNGANGARTFALVAADDMTKTNGAYLANGTFSGGAFNAWSDTTWRHIAIVRDHTDGIWQLYVNGQDCGTVSDVRKPLWDGSTMTAERLCLGGTVSAAGGAQDDQVIGRFDCLRAAKGALTAQQLLCESENPQAASSGTLGIWPLNLESGVVLNAKNAVRTDGSGDFDVGNYALASYLPACSDDEAPVITNVDTSVGFVGDPAEKTGSMDFATPSNAFLGTSDRRLLDLVLDGRNEWTFECYAKFPNGTQDGWGIFFCTRGPGNVINLTFRGTHNTYRNAIVGFNQAMNMADTVLASGLFADGEWHHFACVHGYTGTKAYEVVYYDGVEVGRTGLFSVAQKSDGVLYIGGRGDHTADMRLSSVRFSSAALGPTQFLNAKAEPAVTGYPGDRESLGVWPLDSTDSAVDLSSRTVRGYAAVGEATGQDDSMGPSVRRPDPTPSFDGDPKANVGSVLPATGGALAVDLLGSRLVPGRAFTAEGWIKVPSSAADRSGFVCGAWSEASEKGWRLVLADDGRFHVNVRGHEFFDQAFASDETVARTAGRWLHVALVTVPAADGSASWSLYLDGQLIGVAAQPKDAGLSAVTDETPFLFGYAGGSDYWRVSLGALDETTFLYKERRGMILLFR